MLASLFVSLNDLFEFKPRNSSLTLHKIFNQGAYYASNSIRLGSFNFNHKSACVFHFPWSIVRISRDGNRLSLDLNDL